MMYTYIYTQIIYTHTDKRDVKVTSVIIEFLDSLVLQTLKVGLKVNVSSIPVVL